MSIKQRFRLLERDANRTASEVEQLRDEIDEASDEAEERMERVEQRLTSIESNVAQILTKLNRITLEMEGERHASAITTTDYKEYFALPYAGATAQQVLEV